MLYPLRPCLEPCHFLAKSGWGTVLGRYMPASGTPGIQCILTHHRMRYKIVFELKGGVEALGGWAVWPLGTAWIPYMPFMACRGRNLAQTHQIGANKVSVDSLEHVECARTKRAACFDLAADLDLIFWRPIFCHAGPWAPQRMLVPGSPLRGECMKVTSMYHIARYVLTLMCNIRAQCTFDGTHGRGWYGKHSLQLHRCRLYGSLHVATGAHKYFNQTFSTSTDCKLSNGMHGVCLRLGYSKLCRNSRVPEISSLLHHVIRGHALLVQ